MTASEQHCNRRRNGADGVIHRSLCACLILWVNCIACQPAAAQLKASSSKTVIERLPRVQAVLVSEESQAAFATETAIEGEGTVEPPIAGPHGAPFGPDGASLAIGSTDPAARWVFFCQDQTAPSRGTSPLRNPLTLRQRVDAMDAYLVRPPLQPRRLDALLAASADGRYLVLLEAQQPVLYDAALDSTTSLAGMQLDLRADALRGWLRSLAFSPDGTHLAMLTRGNSPRVIVWDLPDHRVAATVTPVGTTVWRVAFDASGSSVVLKEVIDDTNGNGRIQWPIRERPLHDTLCSARIGALDAWSPTGDVAVTTVAPVQGGKARRIDGFVARFGSTVITRRPGETLFGFDGKRSRRLATTDCDAHVIALSARFGQILTFCTDDNGQPKLELASLGGTRTYDFEVPTMLVDYGEPEVNRFRALYAGVRTYLVDFQLAQVTPLEDRDQVLAEGEQGLIIRRRDRVLLIHPESGRSETLLDTVPSGTRLVLGPGHVLVGSELLSASQGKPLGRIEHPAVAVSSNGCALGTLGIRAEGDPLLKGPLQWICPGS